MGCHRSENIIVAAGLARKASVTCRLRIPSGHTPAAQDLTEQVKLLK